MTFSFVYAQNLKESIIKVDKGVFPRGIISGNVKSIKVNEYQYKDNLLDKRLKKAIIISFNKNKKIIKEEYLTYADNNAVQSSIAHYIYDSNNNLVKQFYANSKDTSFYFYDTKNRLILEKKTSLNTTKVVFEQKFDNLNRTSEQINYGRRRDYFYEGKSMNCKSTKSYDQQGILFQTVTFEYDEWGNWIKETTINYLLEGTKKEERVRKFDHSKEIYLKTSWGQEDYTSYDSLGGIALKKYTKQGLIYEYKTVYDSLNNEKEVVEIHNGKPVNYFDFIYEFYN